MQLTSVLTTLTLLTLLSTTLGIPLTPRDVPKVTIKNHCQTTIYLTSIARERHNNATIPASSSYSEALYYDGITGTSLQITTTPSGLDHGGPILNAAYTFNKPANSTYYSLSTVDGRGYAFEGQLVLFYADRDTKGVILWEPGKERSTSTRAFLGGETDLVLDVCAMRTL
ncbi:hypothetical protein DM02DRAFT_726053 [Periconia macrospinosa]|uniref:Uncharacterized protein n=1 Tax=Periconia macrospinosa TaxID=97972 RepID=A0A2V1E147_9PLEO|nr:hypothetical protein DM02DRAFT_726053 [Periconia macrospinosa]